MTKPKDKKKHHATTIDDIPIGQLKHIAYDQHGNPVQVHAPKGNPDTEERLESIHGPVNHTPSDQDWKPVEHSRPPAPEEIDDEDEGDDEEEDSTDETTRAAGGPALTVKEIAYLKVLAHASTCDTPGCAVKVDWGEGASAGYLAPVRQWPLCEAGRELRKKVK